ncbi:MAG: alkaline phosphatase family protein [Halosimplex sp.]
MGDRPRTVVVCFDGLSLEYLDRYDLPNFSALRDRGIESPLESTFPPWTGSAWPSMYTGTDPSTHGVYDFFSFDDRYPESSDLVTRNDVRAPALWNYLTARGTPSVVLNVPVTYPAEPIEGALVPGYLAPEDADGHPTGIRDRLADSVDGYHIYSRAERGAADDHSVADYVDLIETRGRAARYLLDTEEWRLAVLQVQKTDAVFHNFGDHAAFERVYRAADGFLGTVLDAVGRDTNVIVCSDHGIGETDGYRIYLNQILAREGYTEATAESGALPKLGAAKDRLVEGGTQGNDDAGEVTTTAVRAAVSALRRVGLSPDDVSTAVDRLRLLPLVTRHFSEEIRATLERGVDWRASTAYCRSGNELGVRLNVAGREPDGVVPPDEYEAVRDDLIEVLSALETPDGEPAFDAVKRREAVYRGPYADDACDILVWPRAMNNTLATNLMGAAFVPLDDYDHKRDGTFIGAGPGFAADATVDGLSLVDVAPLAMALLGCPVPERMTGSAPESLLTARARSESYGDVPFGTGSQSEFDDDPVEDRLEDLGYLE